MAVISHLLGYDRRLAAVEKLVRDHGLQPSKISTMAYSEQYAYPYNNYLFRVDLATPASSAFLPGTQPGTTKAPSDGLSALVVKLSNPCASDVNNTNRVENDVAVQHLVRQSMSEAGLPPLVPAIYAWAPTTTNDEANETAFGWIMSELRSGVDLDTEFSSLGAEDKEMVLEQVAAALGAIQAAKLPENVTKFGGLTFNTSGQIVSGEATLRKGAPVDSYANWRAARLRGHLDRAAESAVIQGWKSNGVDKRIENFLNSGGLEKTLAGVDLQRKGLVHGDFTMNNLLFDKDSKRITAVLDFDWSFVSNPLDEFLSSLFDVGGQIDLDNSELDAAILSGDFSTPTKLEDEAGKKWEAARAWNATAKRNGVLTPSEIQGARQIVDLLRFQNLLCPYSLANESYVKKMGEEKTTERRVQTEADIVQWLSNHGF
ncbi:Protein kinase-like domain protein [Drechmeria coniospora]|uniref:non-specific serine/threonine protein kinase n=1 Tax=Drechmeria coniospora TaxID=98403 RepID=A0A151GCT2_DRECN|nr:Protein kinase-like domain protein [Drechmeria coniospora]KYK54910.1 Protein kinase-like domain protein [Drechmeria coniospora]